MILRDFIMTRLVLNNATTEELYAKFQVAFYKAPNTVHAPCPSIHKFRAELHGLFESGKIKANPTLPPQWEIVVDPPRRIRESLAWDQDPDKTITPKLSSVDHPAHYNQHPSGVECWDIIEHMTYNLGAAMKYIWRADHKHDSPTEDLEKAEKYIAREIQRLNKLRGPT